MKSKVKGHIVLLEQYIYIYIHVYASNQRKIANIIANVQITFAADCRDALKCSNFSVFQCILPAPLSNNDNLIRFISVVSFKGKEPILNVD